MVHKSFIKVWLQLSILAAGSLAILLHYLFLASRYSQLPLIIVVGLSAWPVLGQIIIKLYHREIGADILALLSIITALWLGEWLTSVLVIMMLAGGQVLEAFAVKRASSVLLALIDRMPRFTKRKVGDIIETIAVLDIKIGDVILVSPHETCPVDAVVIAGQGTMDESYLTGEPYHVKKAVGSTVLSGALNGSTLLTIKATKFPKDSRYDQILQVMKDAEAKRPELRRLGDQLGALFAPLALIIAGLAWAYSGDAVRFLAVLVIATPCPLLIAIPVVIISSISRAAAHGIIIRDPSVLERLPTCTTAIFDKTGTLTYGQPELSDIFTKADKNDVLQKVASLERYSKHPLAQAVLSAAKKAGLNFLEVSEVKEEPGIGLSGRIGSNTILVTHRSYFLAQNPKKAEVLPKTSVGLECIVLIDQDFAAVLTFRDQPRADSRRFIHHLAPFHAFKRIIMLSGDRASEVDYLGAELGISERFASQSPEQKLALVRAESLKAPTLFMGDGINDAPALAAATVGLAFGQNSPVSSEAAGAVILDNTLIKVDELFHLSIKMRHIALQSALGGMLLSLIGMAFAAFGYLEPVFGALLQQGIDAAAIINSLRLVFKHKIVSDMDKPI